MIEKMSPALRGIPLVEGSDLVEMLWEMIDHLEVDFGFPPVKLAGEAPINRTTEPVVRFLVWLERTPEAQTALRFALRRLASRPNHT